MALPRDTSWLPALVALASFATFHCGGSAEPTRPPIASRGPTRPVPVASGTGGSTSDLGATGATSWDDDAGGAIATGADEEPIPACTALASCCATFETNDLQSFCEETLVTASQQECANAVENFGCATN
jgi:hypothetical protein